MSGMPGTTSVAGRMAILVLTALFLFLFAVTGLSASTWYVAPSGSDDADGSIGTPWATVTHALEQAQPGDVILLRAGMYTEQISTVRDGADGLPITIASYPGEQAISDGNGANFRNGIIIAHDYIDVYGLLVRNWADTGIWLQGYADHIVIRSCTIRDCGAGIDLYEGVHDFVIDSVDISGFREESHGLDMTSHNGDDIYNGLISNSSSHDGGGGNCDGFALGHDDYGDVYGSFTDVHDIRLVNCTAYNVGDGFDISGVNNRLEGCTSYNTFYGGNYKIWGNNCTLVNCVGYNAGANLELDHFVHREPDDPEGTPPSKVEVYNCTFFNARSYNIAIQTDSCRLRMYNTIVLGGWNIGIVFNEMFERGVYTGDYNLFGNNNPPRMMADPIIDVSLDGFISGAWTALSGQDSHSVTVLDPRTVIIDTASATANLHLRDGSPAIDAGIVLSGITPATDRDGRPRESAIDIGAYEVQGPTRVILGPESGAFATGVVLFAAADALGAAFHVDRPTDVTMSISDVRGELLRSVVVSLDAGARTISIATGELPSGAYLVWLEADGVRASRVVSIVR